MNMNVKKAKKVMRANRLKRCLKNIDYGFAIILSLGIGFIIGAICGIISALKMPMTYLDTVFSRFLETILYAFGGGAAGAGAVFIIVIFIACFIGIWHFISDLRG